MWEVRAMVKSSREYLSSRSLGGPSSLKAPRKAQSWRMTKLLCFKEHQRDGLVHFFSRGL